MFWTDDNATSFIEGYYPQLFPIYQDYNQIVQRADLLRYALLHHFGGIYLDLDITCLEPLDNLLHLPWLTPGAYPSGINNAFILSRPQHPFVAGLLEQIPDHDLKWPLPYVETMLSTGCMFFSYQWLRYTRRLLHSRDDIGQENMLYVLADGTGDMDPHMLRGKVITPLFAHGGASSWHGRDAAVIVIVGKHYGKICIFICCCFAALALFAMRAVRLSRTRRTSQGTDLSRDVERTLERKDG